MTYFNDTRRSSFGFGGLVARLRDAYAYHSAYGATRRELDMLSKRELDDLGISTANLHDIAVSAAEEAVASRR